MTIVKREFHGCEPGFGACRDLGLKPRALPRGFSGRRRDATLSRRSGSQVVTP